MWEGRTPAELRLNHRMGGPDGSRRKIWALAREQHGVVARPQLVACGYTNRQVERLLDRGEARRLHRGVYLLGPMLDAYAQAMAAVLACGTGALVSHHSGACLYKLLPLPAEFDSVDITVTSGRVESQPGIRVHRTAWLRSH
jgi:Transcriptional regulator, AbiEi antitoxin